MEDDYSFQTRNDGPSYLGNVCVYKKESVSGVN